MTALVRAVAGTATLAALAVSAAVALGDSQAEEPDGVRTDCARQSSAQFPGAYGDRRNLVVGPLALIGGATFTDAATTRRFGGNKFPLLVRAGHTVTVSLPPSERHVVSLGYGPLAEGEVHRRDGHSAVTFAACSAAESQSTADGPVTFWSGFVMTDSPRCVALDVRVDAAAAPLRRHIELGRRCAKPPPLRDCATRGEGGRRPQLVADELLGHHRVVRADADVLRDASEVVGVLQRIIVLGGPAPGEIRAQRQRAVARSGAEKRRACPTRDPPEEKLPVRIAHSLSLRPARLESPDHGRARSNHTSSPAGVQEAATRRRPRDQRSSRGRSSSRTTASTAARLNGASSSAARSA